MRGNAIRFVIWCWLSLCVPGIARAQFMSFPLDLGNRWSYQFRNHISTAEIVDIVTIDSNRYFVLHTHFMGDSIFLRTDTVGNF